MKKFLSMACVAAMCISSLAGCSAPPAPQASAPETPAASESQPQAPAEAASSGGANEMTIYIRMMDAQDKWFRENIIAGFEKQYGVKINVNTFQDSSDILNLMELDKDKKTIGLVKTEVLNMMPAVSRGYYMDMKDAADAAGADFNTDIQEYSPEAVAPGIIDGTTYFIPRKSEPLVVVYVKSKVDEAVSNWKSIEAGINQAFKDVNGFGLPEGYELEADPNQWDYYDIAVAGYYWANTEYNGKKEPKVAHRGRDYAGTTLELVSKIYQLGGTPEDILEINSKPVEDMFAWEVFYKDAGIYNPTMWQEEWTGGGIYNGFAAGSVYLAFMSQMDAFQIHGGSNPAMPGFLADPSDMGVAISPKGMSLEIQNGQPAREGSHTGVMQGWWWGIPNSTPDAKLSYELVRWITNAENQKAECTNFGILPVRNDILADLDGSFTETWMQEVFNAGLQQLKVGSVVPTQVASFVDIGQIYNNAWKDIVVEGNSSDIGKTLTEIYQPQVDAVK